MKIIISLIAATFMLAGCQTINVTNGGQQTDDFQMDEWHQIGIIGLVEYSKPVDLSERCHGKDWSVVQTRESVGQVFLSLIPYLDFFWSPREVSIECKHN